MIKELLFCLKPGLKWRCFCDMGDQTSKMIAQISSQLANCSKLQRLYFGSGTTPTQRFNLFKAVQVRHLAFLASFLSELFLKKLSATLGSSSTFEVFFMFQQGSKSRS